MGSGACGGRRKSSWRKSGKATGEASLCRQVTHIKDGLDTVWLGTCL